MDVATFISRWTASGASERANKDTFLIELCDVLGVPRPDPKSGDRAKDRYCFEADAVMTRAAGAPTVGKMDLYKADAFVLEAKQSSESGSAVVGTVRRSSAKWTVAMNDAMGQALGYARALDAPPPFLVVVDIGYCIDLYASFDGTTQYQPFPDPRAHRIYLAGLAQHLPLLRTIWTDPKSLDPSLRKAEVTREIAGHVADLAASLQKAGHAPEVVAKFLMRCLFTMFAEDVDLLPHDVFTDQLAKRWIAAPETFAEEVSALWQTMNTGGLIPGMGRILRFNGGLFADATALPVTGEQLRVLHAAARCGWADVEPAIFGTLLERALDERERHRLGAHYTPRAYVERLVRPTLEEPLRARWDLVRVEARQLVLAGKVEEATEVVGRFHNELCTLRVLDPACGTGNFLYVALDTFKRLESEVLATLAGYGDHQAFGKRVTPAQFLGIEKKPWAKEIAELVLWMGYLSWNVRISGKGAKPKEPVLENYGHIEGRDAVLAWDGEEPVLDAAGAPVTRWDGVTMKLHPVTGNEVPDDTARVPVVRYLNPRAAAWPAADFVVGNPPFIGTKRMRHTLGDAYVEAIRCAYANEVEDNADFVMYWWHHAAGLATAGDLQRFGLISTNSIHQSFNRRLLQRHIDGGLAIVWAVPDHPWTDTADGAAVRIAMTVASAGPCSPCWVGRVVSETDDQRPAELVGQSVAVIGADLRGGVSLSKVGGLRANDGLCSMGVALHGRGFVVEEEAAERMRSAGDASVVVRYVAGRDLLQTPRVRYLIDFSFLTAAQARERNPLAFQHVMDHVKPERDQNRRAQIRDVWWRFGWERPMLRRALERLPRFIVTTETSKHRVFQFLPEGTLADHGVAVMALANASDFGVLSSRIHGAWALAAGGRLGVGNDPRYNKTKCFDPFPFPTPTDPQRARIAELGERLDAHRKAQQAKHPDLTLTGMYNVLEKLRAGTPLTDKERVIHEHGLVSILKEIHDALDAAVAGAYGWPATLSDEELLERLVALNAERAEEERKGLVRWLRPDYQRPLAGDDKRGNAALPGLERPEDEPEEGAAAAEAKVKWPATLSERISLVRARVLRAPVGPGFDGVGLEEVASTFVKAPRKEVDAILESLSALGIVARLTTPAGPRWQAATRATG